LGRDAIGRRRALGLLGGAAGLAVLSSCGGDSSPSAPTGTSPSTTGAGSASAPGCGVVTAEETAGPYGDLLGMVGNPAFHRRDITEGRAGVPLTLTLEIVNVRTGCTALAGADVEIWHCDANGFYSEYAQPGYDGSRQTFLRGVQTTDASGRVTFVTIFPGWYMGRATHIHVQVYVGGAVVKTTQIAFPEGVTSEVYASGVYADRGTNPTTNAGDGVFSDGTSTELASVGGTPSAGYAADLTIRVSG